MAEEKPVVPVPAVEKVANTGLSTITKIVLLPITVLAYTFRLFNSLVLKKLERWLSPKPISERLVAALIILFSVAGAQLWLLRLLNRFVLYTIFGDSAIIVSLIVLTWLITVVITFMWCLYQVIGYRSNN